jgi:hypothetical protein
MASSGMLRRVALVRTDFSEERRASIIRVTRIGEVGTALAATSNRRTLCISSQSASIVVKASVVPSTQILVTLKKEALSSSERRFLQEPHGVTSQKTTFFIVSVVKTSNLT